MSTVVDRYAVERQQPGSVLDALQLDRQTRQKAAQQRTPNPEREPRNLTPTFMQYAIEAWRKDYKIIWAVMRTAEKIGCSVESVFNRPKTPFEGYENKSKSRVWMARYFRRVSDALIDGASDKDALLLWINTGKHDRNKHGKMVTCKEDYHERIKPKQNLMILFRERDKTRDWNTVK